MQQPFVGKIKLGRISNDRNPISDMKSVGNRIEVSSCYEPGKSREGTTSARAKLREVIGRPTSSEFRFALSNAAGTGVVRGLFLSFYLHLFF